MTDPLQAEIEAIVAPLVAAQGLELWGLEYSRGKRSLLRIYVEAPQAFAASAEQDSPVQPEAGKADGESGDAFDDSAFEDVDQDAGQDVAQGVSIAQCARVSRQVGLALDVEDIVPGAYVLEVSSPGLSRPFFRLEQMRAYVGQEVEVTLYEPRLEAFPGRKSFKGALLQVTEDGFALDVVDGPHGERAEAAFSWDDVKKTRLAPEVPVPAKPKKEKKRKKGKRHG